MQRTVSLPTLEDVRIASPCPVRWDDMQGDDRVRHCKHCDLNVYNLSALSRAEAEHLIRTHEGRLCGGFHRRADGTILTRDCPVGLRAVRRSVALAAARIAAAIALLITGGITMGAKRGWWSPRVGELEPYLTIREWLRPSPPQISPGMMAFGEVCIPAPQPGGN